MDLLDTALRVALVELAVRCQERTERLSTPTSSPNLSDIYSETIHDIKAMCLGIMDPQEYLERAALSS